MLVSYLDPPRRLPLDLKLVQLLSYPPDSDRLILPSYVYSGPTILLQTHGWRHSENYCLQLGPINILRYTFHPRC